MRYGWDDTEQISRVVGEKFWWDNEDLEGEMGTHTAKYTGESFSSQASHESHRSEQEVLVHEWYEIEETLGMKKNKRSRICC